MKVNTKMNIILLCIVALLCVIPLIIVQDSEFEGADGEAEEIIAEINEDYEPWFDPLFEPPGGETESMLFALQAAIGSGVVFYFIGYLKGKHKQVQESAA